MADSESTLNTPSEPPVKRRREGPQARRAFDVYGSLGAARTPEKVAAQIGRKISQVLGWSQTYHWPDRAVTYDEEQAQLHLEQEQQRQQMENDRWAQHERDQYEAMDRRAQKSGAQGDLMIGFPLVETQVTTKVDKNGQVVEIQILKPARWSKRDAIRFFEFSNAQKQAVREAARASSVAKVIDIFDDLPLESLRVMPK